MFFDLNISVLSIVMFAFAVAALICVSTVYAHRLKLVRAKCADSCSQDSTIDAVLPFTSVVVYSPADAEILAKTLPLMLKQEFRGNYEVIVVDDGAYSDTDTVVKRLKHSFPSLYLTFAPDGARVLSRKKLALTLGIKAAKGDIIVITDSTMVVPSANWLQKMVAPFLDPEVDVVLGYSRHAMPEGRWKGRQIAIFDALSDDVAWLSSALEGDTYRGRANNLAYRKDKFFEIKGFSNSLNLRNGDDDIFVSEIAKGSNVVVMLDTDTIGTYGYDYGVRKEMHLSRLRHAFTGRDLSKRSRNIMTFGECAMWLTLIFSFAGAIFAGVNNLFGWALALVLALILLIFVSVTWKKTTFSLGYDKVSFLAPFIALGRPFRDIIIGFRCNDKNLGNYTWQ